ncbi:SprT family protein [Jeotgalibacillus marinus]|uniref:Protein SprT-like n=1 Tax=Jeotgalibacillus marinus TaxID=86667 RepID=A0ABV3Q7I7_9BACL
MDDLSIQQLVESISLNSFGKPFRHKASFNSRLKTTGGRFMLASHNIELNFKYLHEHGLEELKGIIKHELCHYHLYVEGKGYKHRDRDFKELITQVSAPRYCTPLPSERKQNRRVKKRQIYQCTQCQQRYVRKIKINLSRYSCGICKGKLKYIGELAPV